MLLRKIAIYIGFAAVFIGGAGGLLLRNSPIGVDVSNKESVQPQAFTEIEILSHVPDVSMSENSDLDKVGFSKAWEFHDPNERDSSTNKSNFVGSIREEKKSSDAKHAPILPESIDATENSDGDALAVDAYADTYSDADEDMTSRLFTEEALDAINNFTPREVEVEGVGAYNAALEEFDSTHPIYE